MLHVDPGSVANWIDQGLLKAHRTPGGHRRVSQDDLVSFLREHKMPLPDGMALAGTSVLVVDDEPAIAQLVSRAVKAAHPDFEVHTANDGFSAGTIVASLKPDVVILDLRMPGMDGFDVCKFIKNSHDSKHAEIIAMTAYPSPENQQRILDCGARTCLSKPLDMDQLLSEVSAAI